MQMHHHHHPNSTTIMPPSSSHHWIWPPTPSPSPSPSPSATFTKSTLPPPSPSKSPVDFSPPLIAMVVVIAAAFLLVTYSRLIARHLTPPLHRLIRRFRRRRRTHSFLPSSSGDLDSLPYYYDSPFDPHIPPSSFSPYGLDDSVIKTIPFSLYAALYAGELNSTSSRRSSSRRDCAVCLFEFEDDDYVRTLPLCSHTFHVDCIDAWLRSHANCPLCRAGVLSAASPFTPMFAARIRPSLDDDAIFHRIAAEHTPPPPEDYRHATATVSAAPEITVEVPEEGFNGRDFLLKRSYSFGFERSLASERMLVMEPATASPWRYRRGGSSSSFWSKRPSPFGSIGKPRVFSFRYYRGMKSPFFRRRGFFPLSESSMRYAGGGSSSRRSKSIASPMFLRSSVLTSAAGAAGFSSSRLRCGDPEALLSPERFNRR
ncbi:hypothetical protein HN51_034269 [Arachis hypogaea]|nr:RING-H2 finger protein ATL65 [Arachis hypogaea]QHN99105.1 RING-H2 finger protein [Arachis hypogaea]